MSTALHWDPVNYARTGRFVADLAEPVVRLLAARPDERILDLGCGDGALALAIAGHGARVTGVDCQLAMVEAARAHGLDARCMDGQHLAFEQEFDAVFSNAALHWMQDLDAVVKGVWRALVPGGRFVGECGAAGNIATVRSALWSALARREVNPESVDPWTFPEERAFARLLAGHGFSDVKTQTFERPTELDGPFGDWLKTFAQPFLDAVPAENRGRFAAEVEQALLPALFTPAGRWRIDYVRLRFRAVRAV